MKLIVRPNTCIGTFFDSTREREIFTSALLFNNPNPPSSSRFNPYYDGKVSFWLDIGQQTFPTGFFEHVFNYLLQNGINPEVEISKMPVHVDVTVDPNICDGMTMRDYQIEAVKTAIEKKRGLVTAPPRSGKTLMQAAVAKTLNLPSVIFVQREGLLRQHYENLQKWGMDPGVIQGSQRDYHKQHCVAMLQTVNSSLNNPEMRKWLNAIEVMQTDECHHSSAETYYRTALECPATWRLGYSGTPFQMVDGLGENKFVEDNWRLYGLYGPQIVNVSLQNLQDLGLLVPVHVVQVRHRHPDMTDVAGEDWHKVHNIGVVNNDSRNNTVAYIASQLVAKGYMPLVLVKQVAHGEEICDRIKQHGVVPMFAKGGKNILRYLNSGKSWISGNIGDAYKMMLEGVASVLVATQIGDEGVDLPHVNALVLAVGGKADQVTTQRIFRPLTSTGTKNKAIVIDFDDRQHGVLQKHSATRRRIYRLLGFEPSMKELDVAIAEIPHVTQ